MERLDISKYFPGVETLSILAKQFLGVERLNISKIISHVQSVWRDWKFHNSFSGVDRLNISENCFPVVERFNISEKYFLCVVCREIETFQKHIS